MILTFFYTFLVAEVSRHVFHVDETRPRDDSRTHNMLLLHNFLHSNGSVCEK